LDSPCQESLDGSWREPSVPPGFQNSEGQVFGGTEAFRKSLAQETTSFQQLDKQMGHLQEEVVDLRSRRMAAVGVLSTIAPVFPDVEAFVFNFPSDSSSIAGYFADDIFCDLEIGNPAKSGVGQGGLEKRPKAADTFEDTADFRRIGLPFIHG
jgi:hypothetical protein